MNVLLKIITTLISIAVSAFLIMFFVIYHSAAQDTEINADAIVVLGAAQYDGTPSPVFQSRLDHAYNLYTQDRAPLIIVSGGKQPGDNYSEALSGKKYLAGKGVPEKAILTDENSFSTKHNIARVKDIATAQRLSTFILVSDPFHMYRALVIAHDFGLSAEGSPTRTSPITSRTFLEIEYVSREVLLTYAHMLFDL